MKNKYIEYMDKSTALLLEELSNEYIERVIKYIVEEKRIPIEGIKMRDIVDADERLMKSVVTGSVKNDIYRKVLNSMGMLYALLGIFLIIYDNYRFDFSQQTQFGLFIIMAGLFISILSYTLSSLRIFYLNRKNRKSSRITDYKMLFISNWSVLEREARNLLMTKGFKETTNIRSLFEELQNIGVFSEKDMSFIISLIKMRNELVHGVKVDYSNEDIRSALADLENLIQRIRTDRSY